MENGVIKLRVPDLAPKPTDCVEEVVDENEEVGADAMGHGGGDIRLAADTAMLERRVVEIN